MPYLTYLVSMFRTILLLAIICTLAYPVSSWGASAKVIAEAKAKLNAFLQGEVSTICSEKLFTSTQLCSQPTQAIEKLTEQDGCTGKVLKKGAVIALWNQCVSPQDKQQWLDVLHTISEAYPPNCTAKEFDFSVVDGEALRQSCQQVGQKIEAALGGSVVNADKIAEYTQQFKADQSRLSQAIELQREREEERAEWLTLLRNDPAGFNKKREEDPKQVLDFHNEDFSGLDLTGINFDYFDLRGVKFTKATIKEGSFKWTNLGGASFEGAKLQKTTFQFTELYETSFAGSDLTGVTFSGCYLAGVSFQEADLSAVVFQPLPAPKGDPETRLKRLTASLLNGQYPTTLSSNNFDNTTMDGTSFLIQYCEKSIR